MDLRQSLQCVRSQAEPGNEWRWGRSSGNEGSVVESEFFGVEQCPEHIAEDDFAAVGGQGLLNEVSFGGGGLAAEAG